MGVITSPPAPPCSQQRNFADQERLRHARDRSMGLPVGNYLQPAPMLFTRDGHNLFLGDYYRGSSAFLICSGPSLNSHDLSLLQERGVLTMAVNNAATKVRPQLWCCVDDPGNFSDAIWSDPGITKFVPLCHMEKYFTVRDAHGELIPSAQKVGDMPAVIGYRRNESFVAEQFLSEDTFNWGNHSQRVDALGHKGSRSVMYVALRMLYYLGVRTIYLLGCDFKMEMGAQNYAFPQDRSPASVRGNNQSYQILNHRLQSLLPYFKQVGLEVYNCNAESGLTVFPHKSFTEALSEATSRIPQKILTAGMYDRQARQKNTTTPPQPAIQKVLGTDPSKEMEKLAEVTLVIPVNQGEEKLLRQSFRTWMKIKPWMSQLPWKILRHPQVSEAALQELFREQNLNVSVEELAIEQDHPQAWERAKVQQIPLQVFTRWFWMLCPSAIATSPRDWLCPSLLEIDKKSSSSPPVLTACCWGYTKPADIFERLDYWADKKTVFEQLPPLHWKADENASCLRHEAISTWSCLVETEWAREISAWVDEETPLTEHSTFLLFCAQRQGKEVRRLPLKKYGWDHSFGWKTGPHSRRCEQVLGNSPWPQ